MSSSKASWILTGAMIALMLLAASAISRRASAQEAAPQPAPAKDSYQRSLAIYEFRKAAPSGPDRGQEIFYYKCWFCHNEFTKDIPKLTGLFQHPALLSGQPVNDETVKDKIRNGGPGMAAYKHTLSDLDLNDLVSYLREKCCWDSDSPPPNPRYRAR
jgi:mono/diheme cytochrome c family protein